MKAKKEEKVNEFVIHFEKGTSSARYLRNFLSKLFKKLNKNFILFKNYKLYLNIRFLVNINKKSVYQFVLAKSLQIQEQNFLNRSTEILSKQTAGLTRATLYR